MQTYFFYKSIIFNYLFECIYCSQYFIIDAISVRTGLNRALFLHKIQKEKNITCKMLRKQNYNLISSSQQKQHKTYT